MVVENPYMVLGNPYMVLGNPYMVLGNPYMVADGRAGSRAKLSCGTAAVRPWHGRGMAAACSENCLSRAWPRHGRGPAPGKNVFHRLVLVMVVMVVMVLRYQIQIPRFARET